MKHGTWKADEDCARKRAVITCYDCIRYEKGICPIAKEKENGRDDQNVGNQMQLLQRGFKRT